MMAKFIQYQLVGTFLMGGVTIPAQQPGPGKGDAGFLLQLLGAQAEELNTTA